MDKKGSVSDRGDKPVRDKPVRREQQVYTITSAAVSHSDELSHRERRYAISMAVRTACFLGAVAVDGWLRWVLFAGAIFLPYFAVVLANAGVRKKGSSLDLVDADIRGQLPASAHD